MHLRKNYNGETWDCRVRATCWCSYALATYLTDYSHHDGMVWDYVLQNIGLGLANYWIVHCTGVLIIYKALASPWQTIDGVLGPICPLSISGAERYASEWTSLRYWPRPLLVWDAVIVICNASDSDLQYSKFILKLTSTTVKGKHRATLYCICPFDCLVLCNTADKTDMY